MTPQDIIQRAMRLIGVLGQGNPTPTGYQENLALISLNNLLLSWSRKRLIVPSRQWLQFPLQGGLQNYTMGPGAISPNFGTATELSGQTVLRPIRIEKAGVILPNSPPGQPFEQPMTVFTDNQWASVQLKKLTGTQIFPLGVWPDGGYPLQTLWFWPVPNAPSSVALYVWQPLAQVTAGGLTQSLDLPDGYEDPLCFNLAINLAPEMNKEPGPTVINRAKETLDDLKTSNMQPLFLKCAPGIALNLQPGKSGSGAYNFISDDYSA